MTVRVRFAPSPTGNVHIGNIRAAIFNWLFARHEGGKFLLRIEDTDRERSTPEAIETLLEAMRWLQLDYDEPAVYQSAMLQAHRDAAQRLMDEGKAYVFRKNPDEKPAICFRIPYGSDAGGCIRTTGTVTADCHHDTPVTVSASGIRYAVPGRQGAASPVETCLAGHQDLKLFNAAGACIFDLKDRLDAILNKGESFSSQEVAHLTFTRREVVFRDQVKGELAKPLDGMKDLVIVRSDGSPVFHLANVCDDIAMGITHIIRGDDHVENTYRHVLLFDALGARPPAYAHLPMIVNQHGKPYSKRDGDAYIGDFRTRGFLADALFNYLSLLGWSPGDDREKMTRREMIEAFTLDRVKSGPAQMDLRKLTHLNGQYIADLPFEVFVAEVRKALEGRPWAAAADEAYFRQVCTLMRSRLSLFPQAYEWEHFFIAMPAYDEKAVGKLLRKPETRPLLTSLRNRLAAGDYTEAAIEKHIRETEREAGLGEGKLNQPVRVAVSGSTIGAGLYEIMSLLGRDRVLARLDHAAANLCI
jgi:glutamyl-tRNA synthetase